MPSITLSSGYSTIVDESDFAWLSQWKWYATKSRNMVYAARYCNGRRLYMHQAISGRKDSDHKDGNGLNNQRSNIRAATRAQQMSNTGIARNNRSGFKGVFFDRHRNKWKASIQVNKRTINIGRFASLEEAVRARDKAASAMHGEFARLNMPSS